MNPYISFETLLEILGIAHIGSIMLLLAASNFCLAVIETLEEAAD